MHQAQDVSPQGSAHVPFLHDLHVREGQRPATNMAVAASLLTRHLSIRGHEAFRARHKVPPECQPVDFC